MTRKALKYYYIFIKCIFEYILCSKSDKANESVFKNVCVCVKRSIQTYSAYLLYFISYKDI